MEKKGATSRRIIEVALVDDHELARQGIRNLLRRDSEIKVIGEASNNEDALALINRLQPHVVILDIRLGKGSGIDLINSARAVAPASRILVLTAYDYEQYVTAVARRGVSGYLLKSASSYELKRAIRNVADGGMVFAPEVADKVKKVLAGGGSGRTRSYSGRETLTARESEVLAYLARGLRNTEIATALGISLRTAETHVVHILLKVDAKTRTQAVANARERGWL